VTWPQEPASGRRCRREVVKSVGLLVLHARKWHGRCTSRKRLSRFLSSDRTHVSTPLHVDATNARLRARFSARIRQAGLGCDCWGTADSNRKNPIRHGLAHRGRSLRLPSGRPHMYICIWQYVVTMTPVTHVQGWRTLAAHRPTVWRGRSSTAEDKHDGRLTRGSSRVSHLCRARMEDRWTTSGPWPRPPEHQAPRLQGPCYPTSAEPASRRQLYGRVYAVRQSISMATRWPPGANYQIMSQWSCKATQCAESHSQLNLPLAKRKPSEPGRRVGLPPRCRYCASVALDSISNKRKTRASNLTDLVCTWKTLLLRERLVCLNAYLGACHFVSAPATIRLRSVPKRIVDRVYLYRGCCGVPPSVPADVVDAVLHASTKKCISNIFWATGSGVLTSYHQLEAAEKSCTNDAPERADRASMLCTCEADELIPRCTQDPAQAASRIR
jgi:hypothetical protein